MATALKSFGSSLIPPLNVHLLEQYDSQTAESLYSLAASHEIAQTKVRFPSNARRAIEDSPRNTGPTRQSGTAGSKKFLLVSPYTEQEHLLDLSTISLPNQLLAKALTRLEPLGTDYATASYKEAFNWGHVMLGLRSLLKAFPRYSWPGHRFYIVVFRSRIPLETNRSHLGALDKVAHAEATGSGGLLKYWFGVPDANGRNLATCVWRDAEDAKHGGRGPGHRQAIRETRSLYTEWRVEQLELYIGPNASSWDISELERQRPHPSS